MSAPLKIGILGAGQLGQMMALAAYPLGLSCLFYDRTADNITLEEIERIRF